MDGLFLGALLYGSLFLASVAAAAILWHVKLAMAFALVAMGCGFLSFAFQIQAVAPLATNERLATLAKVCIAGSWAFSVIAALTLLG